MSISFKIAARQIALVRAVAGSVQAGKTAGPNSNVVLASTGDAVHAYAYTPGGATRARIATLDVAEPFTAAVPGKLIEKIAAEAARDKTGLEVTFDGETVVLMLGKTRYQIGNQVGPSDIAGMFPAKPGVVIDAPIIPAETFALIAKTVRTATPKGQNVAFAVHREQSQMIAYVPATGGYLEISFYAPGSRFAKANAPVVADAGEVDALNAEIARLKRLVALTRAQTQRERAAAPRVFPREAVAAIPNMTEKMVARVEVAFNRGDSAEDAVMYALGTLAGKRAEAALAALA